MKRLHRESVISHAKKVVPLPMVLSMAGYPIDGLPDRGVAIKAWCPWTEWHPGAREPEMRVYAGNDCFCFVCQLTMDPVSIAARLWGMSNPAAARRLLQLVEDTQVENNRAATLNETARRRSGAVAALARWADAQGIDRFGDPYGACLVAADAISTDAHVDRWLQACKKHLLL